LNALIILIIIAFLSLSLPFLLQLWVFLDEILMAVSTKKDLWQDMIGQLFNEGKLTSHQCIVYNKDSQSITSNEKCGCQRLIRHHSFDGAAIETKPTREEWTVTDHTKKLPALVYRSTPSTKVSTPNILVVIQSDMFTI
jgi:hypothetical protein